MIQKGGREEGEKDLYFKGKVLGVQKKRSQRPRFQEREVDVIKRAEYLEGARRNHPGKRGFVKKTGEESAQRRAGSTRKTRSGQKPKYILAGQDRLREQVL